MPWLPTWREKFTLIREAVLGIVPEPLNTTEWVLKRPMFYEEYPMQDLTKNDDKTIVMGATREVTASSTSQVFPYELGDLAYFTVRRKDGLIVKYNIVNPGDKKITLPGVSSTAAKVVTQTYPKQETVSFGRWCNHNPADEPLFYKDGVDLYIADVLGFKNHYKEFDTAIDCGSILSSSQVYVLADRLLEGDKKLIEALKPFVMRPELDPSILVIDWEDRKAPMLKPSFWPALVKKMKGTTLIACQGGHGRSGTGAVCMMMVMNPEYSPADAIIHLRAVHCARAIESKEQHQYIGMVGEFLGRPNDIARIPEIKDFKAEFMKFTFKSSKEYQDRLMKGKK